MILKTLLAISLIFNIFFLRKKILKYLRDNRVGSKIPSVSIQEVDEDFKFHKVDDKLMMPSEKTLSQTMFFVEGNYKGITSDYESWVLSVLAKKSKNIFEFGTCSGKTTYLLATNSSDDCKIFTITLDQDMAKNIQFNEKDNKKAKKNAIEESIYTKFFFSGKDSEKKIKVIYEDSKKFSTNDYKNKFDLIFIDGSHSYSYIKNDTEKAIEMAKDNALIFWHDYIMYKNSTSDVVKYLNSISKEYKIMHIKNTNLCFLRYLDNVR